MAFDLNAWLNGAAYNNDDNKTPVLGMVNHTPQQQAAIKTIPGAVVPPISDASSIDVINKSLGMFGQKQVLAGTTTAPGAPIQPYNAGKGGGGKPLISPNNLGTPQLNHLPGMDSNPIADFYNGYAKFTSKVVGKIAGTVAESFGKAAVGLNEAGKYALAPVGAAATAAGKAVAGKPVDLSAIWRDQLGNDHDISALSKVIDSHYGTDFSSHVKDYEAHPIDTALNTAAAFLPGAGKGIQLAAGAVFGTLALAQVPNSIKNVIDAKTPEAKMDAAAGGVANAILGAALLGHSAVKVKSLPTTKTIPGEDRFVPVTKEDVNNYMNNPNEKIAPDVHAALETVFQSNKQELSANVKSLRSAGGVTVPGEDVTVPTTYGKIISMIQGKMKAGAKLTPEEQVVAQDVTTHPETYIPDANKLLPAEAGDAAAAAAPEVPGRGSAELAPTPDANGKVMAQVKLPEMGITGAPASVVAPQAPAAADPTAVPVTPIADLVHQAADAGTPEAFMQQTAQVNPNSLIGIKQSDGTIIAGVGQEPGTMSVLNPATKQVEVQPVQQVLQNFYDRTTAIARGGADPAVDPGVQSTTSPAKTPTSQNTSTPKKSFKRAQQSVNKIQENANTGKPQKSFKRRASGSVAINPMDAIKGNLEQSAIELHGKDIAQVGRSGFGGEAGTGIEIAKNDPQGVDQLGILSAASKSIKVRRDVRKALFLLSNRVEKENSRVPRLMELMNDLESEGTPEGDLIHGILKKLTVIDGEITTRSKIDSNLKESPEALRSVKEGASYLQKVRESKPFTFTDQKLADGAAATFNLLTKRITATLKEGNKVNIFHLGHEVAHEIYNDQLTDAERKEFGAIVRQDYTPGSDELTHKVVAYNYYDLPEEMQGVLDTALKDVHKAEESLLPTGGYAPGHGQMEEAYAVYQQHVERFGRQEIDQAIRDSSPSNARALLKFFRDAENQITNHEYSDLVMEEIFADLGGEYVTRRTGSWSDKMKSWFRDLWNSIKKVTGNDYDKIRDVFKQSYEGKYRTDAAAGAPVEGMRANLEKVNDDEYWQALFRRDENGEIPKTFSDDSILKSKQKGEDAQVIFDRQHAAAMKAEEARRPTAPAFEDLKIGELRELSDVENTPGNDHAVISKTNPVTNPMRAIENYDGLQELRRSKAHYRVEKIFKGMSKDQDAKLFQAAMEYQRSGKYAVSDMPTDIKEWPQYFRDVAEGKQKRQVEALDPELEKVMVEVSKMYDIVAQDAWASGRIRGVRENYITQIWDSADIPDTGLTKDQINFLRGASSASTKFGLDRAIKNYETGIALGLRPKYTKLSQIVNAYLQADATAASGQYFAQDMLSLGDDHIVPTDNGVPPGWKAIQKTAQLKGFSVSPEAYKAMRNIETVSAVREKWLGRAAVKTAQVSTQVLMAGDLLLLKNYFFDSVKASSLGLFRLMYENSKVTKELEAKLVAYGGLKVSEWNPELEGSKFGKVTSALMNEKKNPYFWADYITFKVGDDMRRGLAAMEFNRLTKKGMDEAPAARQAVKLAQDTFGRQNLLRAGRSQTVQDSLRIALISPDYTESRMKYIGKAFQGATYKANQAEYRRYTAGMFRYVVFGAILLETLSVATSGHTSDKNDEGHKLDLEINRGGKKYYVNLLGVMKTDLRFIQGFSDLAQGDPSTLTRFIGNKGSSIERAAQALITQKDYQGNALFDKYTDTPLQKLSKLGIALANNFVPLPVQGFTNPAAKTGDAPKGVEGFIFRTLGLDLYNPQKMSTKVRQSLTELENDKQSTTLDVYSLVRAGKLDEAQKEIDDFNAKADKVGNKLAKSTGISDVDKKSLEQLGASAAIDKEKLVAKAQASKDSGGKPNPISNLIDYGVGGITISGNKSDTGKANQEAAAQKAAETRKANSSGRARKSRVKKPRVSKPRKGSKSIKKARVSKPRRVKSLKTKRYKA